MPLAKDVLASKGSQLNCRLSGPRVENGDRLKRSAEAGAIYWMGPRRLHIYSDMEQEHDFECAESAGGR